MLGIREIQEPSVTPLTMKIAAMASQAEPWAGGVLGLSDDGSDPKTRLQVPEVFFDWPAVYSAPGPRIASAASA